MTTPLDQARTIANEMEKLAEQLKPDVIRAARSDEEGRKNLDRLEYAL